MCGDPCLLSSGCMKVTSRQASLGVVAVAGVALAVVLVRRQQRPVPNGVEVTAVDSAWVLPRPPLPPCGDVTNGLHPLLLWHGLSVHRSRRPQAYLRVPSGPFGSRAADLCTCLPGNGAELRM